MEQNKKHKQHMQHKHQENNESASALLDKQRTLARTAKRKAFLANIAFAVFLVVVIGVCSGFLLPTNAPSNDQQAQDLVSSSENNLQEHAETEGVETEYHTIVDCEDRSVQVPMSPQRVAVLDSFSGEAAIMLGAGAQLYSVPGGTKSDEILQSIYPELTNLAQASGNQVNIEDLVAAHVDVVLVKSSLSDAERAKLDSVRIPYVVVGYTTFEEQLAAFKVVANVLGDEARERGENILTVYNDIVSIVDEHTATIPEKQRLRVYHSINDVLLTDSATSLGADWIERAGATSVSAGEFATQGSDYTATIETIYQWAPDAVICNVASAAYDFRENAQWQALEAVVFGRVYVIPTGATRWGQRGSVETALAMLWLGCTLYPEVYADVDLKTTVVNYYDTCLGITIDDALYEKIMSGEGIRSNGNGSGGMSAS